jgi:trk system potassium uptake protein TrkH
MRRNKLSIFLTRMGYTNPLRLFLFDRSLQDLPLGEHILAAWFQSMTAMTTVGFNTHPISSISAATLLFMTILMVIGASPSGTGGGLKTTSISAALATIWSSLRGKSTIVLFNRKIPNHRVFAAFASWTFYITIFLIGTGLLLLFQTQAFEDILFEAASALGTVGLSRGITGDLSIPSKIITIALMFIGRLGPLSLGIALFYTKESEQVVEGQEDIAI